MDDDRFDRLADRELRQLERTLDDFDPDELDVELAAGVLTLALSDGSQIVINSHRAAGEIWMAAFRQAWHFAPHEESGQRLWRTRGDELHGDELHATLAKLLGEKLGRPIKI